MISPPQAPLDGKSRSQTRMLLVFNNEFHDFDGNPEMFFRFFTIAASHDSRYSEISLSVGFLARIPPLISDRLVIRGGILAKKHIFPPPDDPKTPIFSAPAAG